MNHQPTLIEVRMGVLAFITNARKLALFNGNGFTAELSENHRIIMALGTCAGIFVRNLDANNETPAAVAHMPSFEMARELLGVDATYEQVRQRMSDPAHKARIESILKGLDDQLSAVAAEIRATLTCPIQGPDLLADLVIQRMGQEIAVHIFGGKSEGHQLPTVISATEKEFRSRGAQVIIEHSVTNLGRRDQMALIAPFATHPNDFVRPANKVPVGSFITVQL